MDLETQLALAISKALATFYDIDTDAIELSSSMGRGKRSKLGTACFETGGFIIDSCPEKLLTDKTKQSHRDILRYEFPVNWGFIIVIPDKKIGLSGKAEKQAFRLVKRSKKLSGEIIQLFQTKLLPSFIEKDIYEFGKALTELDRKTGKYFEKAQGGVYRERVAPIIIEYLLQSGVYGAGQSSWGPALYGLIKEKEAGKIKDNVRRFLIQNKIGGDVFFCRCKNKGAKLEVSE